MSISSIENREKKIEELRLEHSELAHELEEIEKNSFMIPAEEIRAKEIKKLKLQKKTQIEILQNS